MKNYDELFKQNAELPAEATRELRESFIRKLQAELVGRRLMPILSLPASAQTYAYDRVATEPGDATVIAKGAEFPYDEYDLARVTLNIAKIGMGFQIAREDFLAGLIQNEQVAYARRRVAEKEDTLIFDGDADFNILGLLDYAGNTRVAGGGTPEAWDAAGKTVFEIYEDVRALIASFEADKVFPPFTMAVNPIQMNDLRKIDDSSGSLRSAAELIVGGGQGVGTATGLVDEILVSFAVPDGTVLMMKRGEDIARLGVAEDLTVETPLYDADRQTYRGRAFERLVPIVYQYGTVANKSDAIGTITGA